MAPTIGFKSSWCSLIVVCAVLRVAMSSDPSSCVDRFEVHDDKIIRTEDSKKLGAKFIDSVEKRVRLECLELCCRTANCDVFVFEEKVNVWIIILHKLSVGRSRIPSLLFICTLLCPYYCWTRTDKAVQMGITGHRGNWFCSAMARMVSSVIVDHAFCNSIYSENHIPNGATEFPDTSSAHKHNKGMRSLRNDSPNIF